MTEEAIRITSEQMQDVFYKLFVKYEFAEGKAKLLAKVFTESTLVGVNSHGINRLPLFIDYVEKGLVKIDAEAEKVATFGSLERWDGNLGPGIINATKCTNRAIALAKSHGMGLVALRNTNHWMRGGTYGRQAADADCISILFTNTQPNMPPWGGKDSRIGNNPLVVSIPREQGHVVLDMSISQFAFGKINDYRLKGEKLPFPGGWDANDELSNDPEKILTKERGLPIGYWKGSALSIVLDMLATLLSAGDSTSKIGTREFETGISQVYLCIYPAVFGDKNLQQKLIDEIITYTHDVAPMNPGDKTYYPGERSAMTRTRNLKEGIPVNSNIWKKIMALSS
ncbi:3-dehydro-L-gulonate 2-dehydrogenase [Maribacter polysiphoniae]|uniref:3-dehydro-L-gulonate 2-dehydrogenase n=1 Tax=Maribacter polysiphoniae TaxID=429344 RepID=A0A316E3U8_9FLAO|nr:3-dehydro-L-gulonate 2-dehydrogenase [Maribacter polysiphoniae]MBD1260817.1 3-dehydro-L-gulonate 2-dehydrogenase [Maribacter polysiphoniae]PWK24049.1 3-dehydro-L-gulonate 2-dehydrogenase [Maribacter polysiphoniae]